MWESRGEAEGYDEHWREMSRRLAKTVWRRFGDHWLSPKPHSQAASLPPTSLTALCPLCRVLSTISAHSLVRLSSVSMRRPQELSTASSPAEMRQNVEHTLGFEDSDENKNINYPINKFYADNMLK